MLDLFIFRFGFIDLGVPGGFIRQIAASPDGNQLIVGNSEGFLSLIDLRMSKLLQTTRPHLNEISQVNLFFV